MLKGNETLVQLRIAEHTDPGTWALGEGRSVRRTSFWSWLGWISQRMWAPKVRSCGERKEELNINCIFKVFFRTSHKRGKWERKKFVWVMFISHFIKRTFFGAK